MNLFNYFSEIEDLFSKRQDKPRFLTPPDWALIETWHQKGVPLEIVLAVINRVCDRSRAPKRISSLMYFRQAVEEEHARYLKSENR